MTMPKQAAGGPFKALVWRPSQGEVQTHRFDDPVDALAVAVLHLQRGYQARLSDNAVEWFRLHETAGLKQSDHGGARRAAPGVVGEAPADLAPAERLAAELEAEIPAVRAVAPARARRARAAAQVPAEPEPEPVAAPTARRGRRLVDLTPAPAAAPRGRGRARPPAAHFRAPAELEAEQ